MKTEANHLYEIPVKVRRGPSCPMPPQLIGAYVICYVPAANHLNALKNAVSKLKIDGYIFEDLVNRKINELDPYKWAEYVKRSWSECKGSLPTQEELLRKMDAGEIFYGPFCGWKSEK